MNGGIDLLNVNSVVNGGIDLVNLSRARKWFNVKS